MSEGAMTDVNLKRRMRKYSCGEQFGRVLWAIFRILFTITPRQLWSLRNSLLRLFGAKIGKFVRIYPSVRVQMPWNLDIDDGVTVGDGVILYALGAIHIGERSTVSQGVHLCAGTHDFEDHAFTLLRLPINIEEDVWICADAFVGPNITVSSGAVIGARAVVMKDVAAMSIVAGNPARFIRTRKQLNDRNE